MQSQHNLGGKFDEIYLQDFRHERETSGSTQVALDDLDGVLLGKELNIEWSRDPQRSRYGPGYLLDAPDGFDIKLLRRELDRGITGMDSRIFDVFGNGVCYDLAFICDSVEFDFLCPLVEFADDYRMFL